MIGALTWALCALVTQEAELYITKMQYNNKNLHTLIVINSSIRVSSSVH